MKKTISSFLLVTIIIFSFIAGAFAAGNLTTIKAVLNKNLKITFNGSVFSPKESNGSTIYPIVYNGRTYVPLKPFCDTADIILEADSKTNTISLTMSEEVSIESEQPDKDFSGPSSKSGSSATSGSSSEGTNTFDTKVPITQNAEQFTTGVSTSKTGKYTNVKIDREKIPSSMRNFTKISVCGTDNISETAIARIISDTKEFHYGLDAYNDEKGYNEGATGYMVVMLFDDNVNILGYYIIK